MAGEPFAPPLPPMATTILGPVTDDRRGLMLPPSPRRQFTVQSPNSCVPVLAPPGHQLPFTGASTRLSKARLRSKSTASVTCF